jgi:ADP-ribose pyrophosphatase
MKAGPEVKILKRKVIMKLNASTLVECHLRVGKQLLIRHSVEHPGCVVVIPRLGPDRFLLVKQYRYAARGWIWEFPAGGVEPPETLRTAATRELMEEAGYRPGRLTPWLSFYPTPGVSEEKMHLFLAEKLKPAFAPKDADEDFEIREFRLKEIGAMIERGQIQDGKTILGYLMIRSKLKLRD